MLESHKTRNPVVAHMNKCGSNQNTGTEAIITSTARSP